MIEPKEHDYLLTLFFSDSEDPFFRMRVVDGDRELLNEVLTVKPDVLLADEMRAKLRQFYEKYNVTDGEKIRMRAVFTDCQNADLAAGKGRI